jgi:hypothetical protein
MNYLMKLWQSRSKFYIVTLFFIAWLACVSLFVLSGNSVSEKARSAESFIDTIGVAVHLNYRDTAYRKYEDVIKPRLQELGIRHIRDGVSLRDRETQQKFVDLAKIGIKSTLVMDPRKGLTPSQAVQIAKAVGPSIEAVEGPNEWDLHPELKYQRKNFPRGVRQFQSELYSAIKGDFATAPLNVLSPSMGRPENASKLGKVACDIGVMHSYAGGRMPSHKLDNTWIPKTNILCGTQAIIATECGYHNAKVVGDHQPGVSESAAAKYLNRLFLEYFNRGINRAYTYELIDLKPNLESDRPSYHYGLLRNDGSPKPDFLALKNLLTILKESEKKDAESLPLKSLDYSFSRKMNNVHHTLLQKRNGSLYLILWQEVSSFDRKRQVGIAVPNRQVELSLTSSIGKAATYQPLKSVEPIKEYKNPKKLKLEIPDHPLIVELIPA